MSSHTHLAKRTISAMKWSYAGSLARLFVTFGITVAFARMLGPAPFGLIAIGWLVVGLGNLIADAGLGAALVQRDSLSPLDIRQAFTVQMVVGVVLSMGVFVAAPLIGKLVIEPKAVPVVRALSLVFFLQSWGLTATSLLKRELKFASLQIAQLVAQVAGYVALGIPLALMGYGVWSLVAAQLAQTSLNALICGIIGRHPMCPAMPILGQGLFNFGFKVFASNIINWMIGNADNGFVGRVHGTLNLGNYSRVFTLVMMPVQQVVGTAQNVMFPAYSRARGDRYQVRRVFIASITLVSLILIPVCACIAIAPAAVVLALLGPKWTGAVPLVVPLALAMPFQAALALSGPVLWAHDRVWAELRAELVTMAAMFLLMLVTARRSLESFTWGMVIVYILRCYLVSDAGLRVVELQWRRFLRSLAGPIVVAIASATTVFCIELIVPARTNALLRLVTIFFTGGTAGLTICALLPQLVFCEDARWILSKVFNQLPPLALKILRLRGLNTIEGEVKPVQNEDARASSATLLDLH